MADWIETDDPAIVASPAGQEVPRALVPPSDRIVPRAAPAPATPMAPPAAPGAAPMAGAPAAPLTAQSVLAKLDEPSIAAARGQLPIAQQTTTTQSAVPMSTLKPVMDRGTARTDKQAESVVQLGEQKAQIGEQQAMTASTAAYGQMQQSQAEADQAAQRAEIARMNQIAVAAQEDPEIDPSRFVRGMSTGQSIGTVILAALEGGFRGITGQTGQNTVISILDKRIDQDIAAQKEQLASGRIRRGNMISYFREQGMNEEASEKAAKAMAYAQSEKLLQSELARQGAGMARPEAAALAEQLKAAREQANDELVLSLGTPRSTTSTVRAPAQAAGGGQEGFTKMLAARKAYEESGATPEQLAAFDKTNGLGAAAPGGESEVARTRREKGESRTDNEKAATAALSLLDEYGTQLGLAKDPGGAGFRENPADKSILSKKTGEDFATGFSFGMADNPIEATTDALVESFGRLQSGGVIGPDEEVRFKKMIAGAKTDAQRAIALNSIRPIIEAKLNARDKPQGGAEAAGFKRVQK
jgi:hypothetical protein